MEQVFWEDLFSQLHSPTFLAAFEAMASFTRVSLIEKGASALQDQDYADLA